MNSLVMLSIVTVAWPLAETRLVSFSPSTSVLRFQTLAIGQPALAKQPRQAVAPAQVVDRQWPIGPLDDDRQRAFGLLVGKGPLEHLLAFDAGQIGGQVGQVAVVGHVVPARSDRVQPGRQHDPADDHHDPMPRDQFAQAVEHVQKLLAARRARLPSGQTILSIARARALMVLADRQTSKQGMC